MAVDERNDARGAARLLAMAARDCLQRPATVPDRLVVLNNVYRLLEAYRVNTFFGFEPPTERDRRHAGGSLTLMPPIERHVREVRDALEQATEETFAGQPKNKAIEMLEDVLRGLAYPENNVPPSEEDRTKAADFFETVLRRLSAD